MVKLKRTLSKKEEKHLHIQCRVCNGFGFWPLGDLVPMGEMDSREWKDKVIKCPWCGAGTIKDDDRYVLLEGEKLKEELNEKKTI
jgi:hypothetical protein